MIDPSGGSGVDGWPALGLWAAGLLFAFVMERARKWAQARDDRIRRQQEAENRAAMFDEWQRLHDDKKGDDDAAGS